MTREGLAFAALPVLANTAFPLPFEPVLLGFMARHPSATAGTLALAGTAAAAVGALIDAWWLGGVGRRLAARGRPAGPRFYGWTLLVACSPLPFSIVRAAIPARQPRPLAFAAAVALGRLPRYALLAALGHAVL